MGNINNGELCEQIEEKNVVDEKAMQKYRRVLQYNFEKMSDHSWSNNFIKQNDILIKENYFIYRWSKTTNL